MRAGHRRRPFALITTVQYRLVRQLFPLLMLTIAGVLPSLFPVSSATVLAQAPSSSPAKATPDVPPLYPIRLNVQFGYMDRSGKIIVTPQFQRAWDFHNGMARILSDTKGRGIIDATGKLTFLSQFVWIRNFSEGLAEVGIWDGSNKSGYIDTTGALVIPATWASLGDHNASLPTPDFWHMERNAEFSEGLAVVRADDRKFGYIDKSGKIVIPPQFLYARPFSEGLAVVANDQFAFGYIDKQGKAVIPLTLHNVYPGNFSEGVARIKAASDITFVDHQGSPQVVVKTNFYFGGYDFHDGLAKISENNNWYGFIDRAGHIVAEPHYRYATDFSEGLAAVVDKEGTAGYIDAKGQMVIPLPQGSLGCQFRGGLARVFVDNPTTTSGKTQHHSEMAYIDKSGKFVFSPGVRTRTPQIFRDDGLENCD
jgi:hypothetical protein